MGKYHGPYIRLRMRACGVLINFVFEPCTTQKHIYWPKPTHSGLKALYKATDFSPIKTSTLRNPKECERPLSSHSIAFEAVFCGLFCFTLVGRSQRRTDNDQRLGDDIFCTLFVTTQNRTAAAGMSRGASFVHVVVVQSLWSA